MIWLETNFALNERSFNAKVTTDKVRKAAPGQACGRAEREQVEKCCAGPMPKYLDSNPRAQMIGEAIGLLIARDGLSAPSLRSVASVTRVSPSSLLHQFGTKERLLQVVAHRVRLHRFYELSAEVRQRGLDGFLPDSDDGLLATRVWLAWTELGRADASIGRVIAEEWSDEQHLLSHALGAAATAADSAAHHEVDSPEIAGAAALLSGLRERLCARHSPLTPQRAQDVWAGHASTLLVHAPAAPPAPPPAPPPALPQRSEADSAHARSSRTIASGSSAE